MDNAWTCMAGLKTAQKNDHSGPYSCISTLSNEKTVLKRPTLYRSLRYKLYRRSANHTKALYLLCTGYFCATVSLLPLYYLYKCAISVINICKQYAVYLLLNICCNWQEVSNCYIIFSIFCVVIYVLMQWQIC